MFVKRESIEEEMYFYLLGNFICFVVVTQNCLCSKRTSPGVSTPL